MSDRVLRSSDIRKRQPIHNKSPERDFDKNVRSSPYLERKSGEQKLYPVLDDFDEDSDETGPENIIEKLNESDNNINSSTEKDEQQISYGLIILFIISIIGLIFLILSRNSHTVSPVDCSKFMDLSKKFPGLDPKIFKSLKVSIEGLYNRNSNPPVFSFYSTDQSMLDQFTKNVVDITKSCINQSNDPINLSHSDLHHDQFLNDPSKVISKYKDELNEKTIMIINNLDTISIKILPSLHSFADTYNPLVQKSIIYFTIKVPEEPSSKPIEYIHNHLQAKWNDLSNNIRGPLITRILDQSFHLPKFS